MRIFRSERLKRRDWPAIPSIFGAIARRDLPNKNYSFQIVDGPADYLAPCADGRRRLERSDSVASFSLGYLQPALRPISRLISRPLKH